MAGTRWAKMLGGAMAKKKPIALIEHDEIVKGFAQRLRTVRTSRGMTQADLARKAQVDSTYVSRLESAKAAPGLDMVGKLAAALGVAPTALLPEAEAPDPLPTLKDQARQLFEALLKTGDRESFEQLNPHLALLVEAAKRGAEKPKTD